MDYWNTSTYKLCSAWIFFVTIDVFFGIIKADVNKHLELGSHELRNGRLQDALTHFHAAVESDPKNYLTYFKRATVYLALGKAKFAIVDLDNVIELKPDFTGARNERGHVHLKLGNFEEAKKDFLYVNEIEYNEDAYNSYIRAENLGHDIAVAEELSRSGDHPGAVDILTRIIEVVPWSSYLRELRSQSYLALGDDMSAILDLKSTTKLQSDNTDGYYKLSMLYYQLGKTSESLREIRECLKRDPDHKDCFPHYKKVKKLDKFFIDAEDALNSNDYNTCISSAQKILKNEDKVHHIKWHGHGKLCKCYMKSNKYKESIEACKAALQILRDPELHCDMAEAYLIVDMFDDSIRSYQDALELDKSFQRANEGIERVRKLQKQAEKRDYYKILSVPRSATKKEITKAYRKAAQKWHPDNFPEGPEKKKAELMFVDIAAAKEVLTDPEKRKRFDSGEDPLDPESGQHPHGFNPFQHFHHFHDGTPFTFKFQFN